MVTIVGTQNCMKCTSTKRQFDKHDVAYSYVDASDVPELVATAKTAGVQSFPLVFRDTELLWGDFRPEKVRELAA